MKIVIAGGTGFVGKYLNAKFLSLGYEVQIIARSQGISWDDKSAIIQALEHADLLINLAGKSVNCRYNEKNKAAIFSSRTKTTKILGEAVLACQNPPKLWINSSTATIYRHAEDRPMPEKNGEIGSGFSVEVAKLWEKTFFDFDLPDTRQVALRMAIVLGSDGGVMVPFKNLVRFGLGGRQGNGKQKFSWIHIEDLFRMIRFLQDNPHLKGVYNCASPNPVDNDSLMRILRKEMNAKIGLPSPAWLLKLGAIFIGTETELVLKSRWVIPEKLLEAGFQFKFITLTEAIKNILKR